MARLDWSRLHSKILRSSIWLEDPIVRLVWICAIADSETDGTFYGTYEVLARAWNLPEKDIKRALTRLCEPDPKSGTKSNEGRRIIRENENTWRVLNKRLYNKSGEPVGASTVRVQAFRDRKRSDETDETGNESNGGNGLEENRTEEKRKENTLSDVPSSESEGSIPSKRVKYPPDFEAFWMEFSPPSRRLGKGAAAKIWARLAADDRKKAVDTLPAFKRSNRGKEDRHIATAPTYLSQRRFDDFDDVPAKPDPNFENYRKQMEALKEPKP